MKRHLGNVQFYTTCIALIPRVAPLYPKNFQYANMLFSSFWTKQNVLVNTVCPLQAQESHADSRVFLMYKIHRKSFSFFSAVQLQKLQERKDYSDDLKQSFLKLRVLWSNLENRRSHGTHLILNLHSNQHTKESDAFP